MKKSLSVLTYALAWALSCSAVSCSDDNDDPTPSLTPAEECAGSYSGTIVLNVAGQYEYDADITCVVTTSSDKSTITVAIPDYTLTGTMMGDLSLGAVTISGLEYNEAQGVFYRDFGGEGLTQTMNGTTYPLNAPSSITVKTDASGKLSIDYPFTLGKMPLPMKATFEGAKSK